MTDKVVSFLNSSTGKVLAFVLGGSLITLVITGVVKIPVGDAPRVEAFSAQEMRELLRKEIAPLRAGIEELAKSQSLETQNRVLRAMMRAERRSEEAN